MRGCSPAVNPLGPAGPFRASAVTGRTSRVLSYPMDTAMVWARWFIDLLLRVPDRDGDPFARQLFIGYSLDSLWRVLGWFRCGRSVLDLGFFVGSFDAVMNSRYVFGC